MPVRWKWHALLACGLTMGALPSARADAQSLLKADSAWVAGDRARARQLYSEAFISDSSQSRVVFRLGELAPSPRDALRYFERYVALEPQDGWGYIALAEVLSRLDRLRPALSAYERGGRLGVAERVLTLGRARVWSRAGRPEEAIATLRVWLGRHPGDNEAWELLAREQLRAGRPKAAAQTALRVDSSRGVRQASSILRAARSQQASVLEPIASRQGDSDGNRTTRWGILGSVVPADGLRLGAGAYQGRLNDAVESIDLLQGRGEVWLRPHSSVQLQLEGGLDRFSGVMAGLWVTPAGEARLRWRAPMRGPSLDLRLQRTPLAASPLLVNNRVKRWEVRGSLEIPAGPLRVRGGGRSGAIGARGETTNSRTGADLGLVFPLGWQGELSAQYHRLSYANATTAGYFAPRLVETREGGLYLERETGSGVTVALDIGAGMQRVAEQGDDATPWNRGARGWGLFDGANAGPWKRALRGWGSLAIPLAAGRAIWIEVEGYDAPFAPDGATTAASWRSLSVATGLRWALP